VFVDVDFTTRFYFLFAVVIFPCIEFSFFDSFFFSFLAKRQPQNCEIFLLYNCAAGARI